MSYLPTETTELQYLKKRTLAYPRLLDENYREPTPSENLRNATDNNYAMEVKLFRHGEEYREPSQYENSKNAIKNNYALPEKAYI